MLSLIMITKIWQIQTIPLKELLLLFPREIQITGKNVIFTTVHNMFVIKYKELYHIVYLYYCLCLCRLNFVKNLCLNNRCVFQASVSYVVCSKSFFQNDSVCRKVRTKPLHWTFLNFWLHTRISVYISLQLPYQSQYECNRIILLYWFAVFRMIKLILLPTGT